MSDQRVRDGGAEPATPDRRQVAAVSTQRPALHTFKEAVPIVRKSLSWLYKAARQGLIPHREIGRNKFLSDDDIAAIIRNGARPVKQQSRRGQQHARPARAARSTKRATPAADATTSRLRVLSAPGDIPQADPTASRLYRTGTTR